MSFGTFEIEKKVSLRFRMTPSEKKKTGKIRHKKRKVLVIAGPTGTGKTELSFLLAKNLKVAEVVSADSMQIYRGMDIGTAKVSQEDRQWLPHHLIDIRDVSELFNVHDFYQEARSSIEDILARGKIPLVVGGSGFYIRTLLYGPPDGPPSVKRIRDRLEAEMDALGLSALYLRLQTMDPVYCSTITRGDRHKIIRALEIIAITGQPVSKFSWKSRYPCLDYDFHCWFVFRPRESLYQILENRCDLMVASGFIEEVMMLQERGLLNNPSASGAIGYKQCLEYLDSFRTKEDMQTFLTKFKQASRQYAKKQFTWFRREPVFKWLNIDLHDPEIAADMICQDFLR